MNHSDVMSLAHRLDTQNELLKRIAAALEQLVAASLAGSARP